ncbi:transcriptional repressor [Roseivirga pacifica]|uniref:Fur family transcriptional regulator n=1 Tax=Roseivirga pacifica TaxID=1267423 RepID=UPI0020940CCA|nr:transcriptional repressor [Roseivirga pacifica]MCO6359069.1 transcriptional repressor [Roseivirga pacifica]MCO6365295.1 transcriptional repressor [Roseivirga pacifica]MCO6371975.1 transcriptional repressor [Roseivirga pacifica]MCO6375914.1 transcriptional repressor [Roseivirga pacifica]MCO6379353.1 transcriptional repressor [Roseivirga pacifica]
MNTQIKQILKDHSLRHTQGRADIISVFLNKNVAISHSDIEAEMDSQYDRVTIYRTLKSFLEKGLIHKVLDDTGTMHYALCDDACSEVEHQHDHIHFKCNNCGETTCLENVHIPKVSLPNGFSYEESNYLITGTCDKCN